MTLTPVERALEIFAIIHLGLMGLSHLVRHRAWAEFFMVLREHGHGGVFVHGFLSLGFGAVILALHRVWVGIPAVLSVLGVLYILKSAQCFLLPGHSLRSLRRVSPERSWEFMAPGAAFLTVALVLTFGLVRMEF